MLRKLKIAVFINILPRRKVSYEVKGVKRSFVLFLFYSFVVKM